MIGLFTADQVRAAERAVLSGLPTGTLMLRAATGLATVCLGLLGRAHGVRVVLLVGVGDRGRPHLEVRGTVARRAAELGVTAWHVSLSHDGGIASAVVIAERSPVA